MIAVERFIAALDIYVDARIKAAVSEVLTPVQKNLTVQAAKQTLVNELRLLLESSTEQRSPSPYKRASDWRR